MPPALRPGISAMMAGAFLAGCGLLPHPTMRWNVRLSASISNQAPLTMFTLTPSATTHPVLAVSANETPVPGTAAKTPTVAAVWAPSALAPYLELDAANPVPTPDPALARLSPGRGWSLVAEATTAGGGSIDATIPLSTEVRPTFAQECVLTLAWQDPSGSWWRQRFAVGGRPLGRAWAIPSPEA